MLLSTIHAFQARVMYFSAASRMTQATDTFFCFAISWSACYRSGGKLADTRAARGFSVGLRPRLATIWMRPEIRYSILPHLQRSRITGWMMAAITKDPSATGIPDRRGMLLP